MSTDPMYTCPVCKSKWENQWGCHNVYLLVCCKISATICPKAEFRLEFCLKATSSRHGWGILDPYSSQQHLEAPTYFLVSASIPFLLLMGPILVLLVSEQLKLTFSASKYSGKVVFWLLWPLNSLLIYLMRCYASSAPIDIGYRKPKIRIFGYKIWQKSGFLSFCASESILPPTLWLMHSI